MTVKNESYLSNEFIHGTPDVRLNNPKCTIDTKNVYYPNGLEFFKDSEEKTIYQWQIHGYNFLDQKETGFVEPHMDYNGPDDRYYTRRYNILISLPEEGGHPIYGNKVLKVKERMIWRCDAGLVVHSSIPNKGERVRINLSFGFLMPKPGNLFETKLI
jgi:hypothetical protein